MDILELFKLLNLDQPELKEVRLAVKEDKMQFALELFLEYFTKRNNVSLYLEEDMDIVARYCVDNFKQETKEIIATAEEVKNKTFVFKFRWDMERTNKPVSYKDKILWNHIPFDDQEWVSMLNRHRYWIALGQAYAITKDESYAETFFTQMENWIDNNPRLEDSYKTTWRTIEAGVRCENWIKSFMYFRKSKALTPKRLAKMIISLYDHGKYIHEKYDNYRRLSNWGVLENHGLFTLSVFLPELIASELFLGASIERLAEEINIQVMMDGIHWEQSPMYHNQVLHCYLDTIILANKNNIQLPKVIQDKTKALAYGDLYMAKPNHHQPMQSDSDDTDVRDLITKAAFLFKDSQLKFGAYDKIDFESVWDLGWDSINIYKLIKSEEPKYTSYGFEDSGNYYMRSGWGEWDNYMYFHCGTLGSGHGHADLLHIDIHAKGESILIDSGRYTYAKGNPLRTDLKSCGAHNTTMVDNKDFTICEASWEYSKVALPVKQNFITHEEFDFVEGAHLGYMDLKNPVYTSRKIIFIKPNYWVLVDGFYGNGTHEYKQLFHFDRGDLFKKDAQIIFEGKKARLNIIPVNSNIKTEISDCIISKEYNKLENSRKLVISSRNFGITSIITVLHSESVEDKSNISCEKIMIYRGDGKVVKDDEAEGIKIKLNENEEHLLAVAHGDFKGSNLYVVDGVPVYGKVILIKRENGINKVLNIKY